MEVERTSNNIYMVENLAWLTLSPLRTFQCLMSFSAAFQPISRFTLKPQKQSQKTQKEIFHKELQCVINCSQIVFHANLLSSHTNY